MPISNIQRSIFNNLLCHPERPGKPGSRMDSFRMVLLVLIIGCWILIIPSSVLAQDTTLGLSISPTLDVVDLHNRDPLVLAYTVENNSTIDLTVTPHVRSFHADNESGTPILDDSVPLPFIDIQTPGFALETPFTLKAGGQQQLVLHIIPPADLKHDLTLTFLAEAKPNTLGSLGSGSTQTTVAMIGANMILRTGGDQQLTNLITMEKANIPSLIDMFTPIDLKYLVHNNDVTTHQIRGSLTLKRGTSVLQTFALSPDFVLPESSRQLRFAVEVGNEKQPSAITLPPQLIPWKYTLELTLADESGNSHMTITSLYILPIWITSGVLLLTSCAFLLVRRLLLDSKKKKSEYE